MRFPDADTTKYKGSGLAPLGLYPWALGSLKGILGDYIESYKGYIRAILGKLFRGTTNTTLDPNPQP